MKVYFDKIQFKLIKLSLVKPFLQTLFCVDELIQPPTIICYIQQQVLLTIQHFLFYILADVVDSGLSTGALVGIVIASIVFIIVLLFINVMIVFKLRKRKRKPHHSNASTPNTTCSTEVRHVLETILFRYTIGSIMFLNKYLIISIKFSENLYL